MGAPGRLVGCVVAAVGCLSGIASGDPPRVRGGELRVRGGGVCPLEHTEVEADVTGLVARVRVRQTFRNPLSESIEAVYVFPLPSGAAVDEMTMTVGSRRITGEVRPREAARRLYERARSAGYVAGLLDQERPNCFTQSVANVDPAAEVIVEIGYVETLAYRDGVREFVFPMVVGPRYFPGRPVPAAAKRDVQDGHDTCRSPSCTSCASLSGGDRVPDASRLSPPVARPGFRAGHDVGLTVRIDAGTPLVFVDSVLHDVDVVKTGGGRAVVSLRTKREIPNRDFVLRYSTATDEIGEAFLVSEDERGTFFTLVLEPPRRSAPERAVPREMVFVIDRSGSMRGRPIEKAKATMRLCIEQMAPRDTFNLLGFSGGTGRCFERPVPNTPANRARALAYLDDLAGSGGTEMMPAIREALDGARGAGLVRIVCFMTDGHVGNEFEVIRAVERSAANARVFAFGVGNSVNRFLLEGMARAGRGEVEYVTLSTPSHEAASRFAGRVRSPVLADIEIDWGRLPAAEVYPARVPDLFDLKPILVHGRLERPASGIVMLRGVTGRGPFERKVLVSPPDGARRNSALASLWARAKVDDLMGQDLVGLQMKKLRPDIRDEITRLGVEFRLVTPYTSFVAVEEHPAPGEELRGASPRLVPVPVEMPEGVNGEGVSRRTIAAAPAKRRPASGGSLATAERAGSARPTPARARGKRRFEREADTPGGVEHPVFVHEEVEERTHMETENNMDDNTARGQEDAISGVPLGGTGVVGNLGVGGGGAGCYGFRSGGGRRRAALRGGGSRRSESAVDAALRWLARNQEPDGSWSVAKWSGSASEENRVTVTGLALLSFLGAGHTEKTGKFKANVTEAVAWLVSQQDAQGQIGVNTDRASGGGLNHAIAGLALAEAFGMARVAATGAAAQEAVDCSVGAFQVEYSGWGRSPGARPDTVATAWFVMQLKSAIIAGLNVDGGGFQGAIAWLDKVTGMPSEATGDYGGKARLRPESATVPSATAAAMLARQFMGWKRTSPLLVGGADLLAANLPVCKDAGEGVHFQYWYFGTLSMFQMGGDWWKLWNASIRNMLIQRQLKSSDPRLDGSWEPVDEEAKRLGRAYSTAMCALTLEVYYRYLPLYRD